MCGEHRAFQIGILSTIPHFPFLMLCLYPIERCMNRKNGFVEFLEPQTNSMKDWLVKTYTSIGGRCITAEFFITDAGPRLGTRELLGRLDGDL